MRWKSSEARPYRSGTVEAVVALTGDGIGELSTKA
jgi:hypothetical protein